MPVAEPAGAGPLTIRIPDICSSAPRIRLAQRASARTTAAILSWKWRTRTCLAAVVGAPAATHPVVEVRLLVAVTRRAAVAMLPRAAQVLRRLLKKGPR